MSTKKVLLYALGVTVVSCVLLTVTRGIPTQQQVLEGGATMFAVAFVALRFFSSEGAKKPTGKDV